RRRPRNDPAEAAGGDYHRPPPQRAALRLAAQHHEGEEEADRREDPGRSRRRYRAAPEGHQDDGARRPPQRRQGRLGCRTRRQTEERGIRPVTTLLIAEHDNASIKDATAKALTAAAALGREVHILVAGKDAGPAAAEAAKLSGVAKVLHADGDAL